MQLLQQEARIFSRNAAAAAAKPQEAALAIPSSEQGAVAQEVSLLVALAEAELSKSSTTTTTHFHILDIKLKYII
jgi:hypothetical protein